MTDYKEEQSNEIEALESIYPEELNILETEPFYKFEIPVKVEYTNDVYEDDTATLTLQFEYTAKYPDEAPLISISESEGVEDELLEQLNTTIIEQTEENVGMVIVFTIVSAVQEKMQELLEQLMKQRQEDKEERIRKAEEAEQKRFEGTVVTIETFLAWKAKFDAEMAEKKKQMKVKDLSEKPTGKELFMTDTSLDDSDVKFLEEEGDTMVVDESLFQDMDDLDLEADLDDS